MSELVDLVDKNGEITVFNVPRHEARQHKDAYMQIVILVVFNALDQVLAQRRAATKNTAPLAMDHVCGAIQAGQTPEQEAKREAQEEAGIRAQNLRRVEVEKNINKYGRFRFLLIGDSNDQPRVVDPDEVESVAFFDIQELYRLRDSGERQFVDDFFDDLEAAVAARAT